MLWNGEKGGGGRVKGEVNYGGGGVKGGSGFGGGGGGG